MKLNPYRVAASLLLERLKWDFHPKSWSSRKKMKALHNRYQGKKAVIVCNGPSLLQTNFSLLDDVYTLGLNKINLLFEQAVFRPSCIVSVNPFVIEQNKHFFSKTKIPLFLDAKASRSAGLLSQAHPSFIHSSDFPSFSEDCSFSIFQGYTVTYVAMQLAFHMGFSDVALIGCDHNFHVQGPANQVRTASGPDDSHFHKNYFADGQQWQLPDLHQSETFYALAARIYQENGRRLVNATAGGNLDLLPRIGLADFVSNED
jgi:hypothetical protein